MRWVHRDLFVVHVPGWPRVGVAFVSALVAITCAFPTDRGGSVRAEFTVDRLIVRVGDTAHVAAQAMSGTSVLPGAGMAYASLDEEVAVVSDDGVVLGVGEGETRVVARTVAFEDAATDTIAVFVTRGIFIRDIVAEVAGAGAPSFGEIIEITGLRLAPESLAVATIGGVPAAIVGYDARDTSDAASLERLRLRVPVVPPTSDLLLVHQGGGTAARTLEVVQEDVFELRGLLPVIDLGDGDYVNDALTASAADPDLLRFVLPAGNFTLTATILGGRLLLEGEPQLRFLAPQGRAYAGQFEDWYDLSPLDNAAREPDQWAWTVENRGLSCDFRILAYYPTGPFNFPRGPGNVLTLALANTQPDTVDFIAATRGTRIQYKLEARAGYNTALPPDALEENDACVDAAPLSLFNAVLDLNFDNPTDFDWFAVTIAEGAPVPSFDVTPRDEQEPNDSFGSAETVTFGSRVVGLRDGEGDVDVYGFDAVAGTLIDVDIRAWNSTMQYRRLDCPDRCSPGLPPYAPPGSSDVSDLSIVARLFDSAGAQLAVDSSPSWGAFRPPRSRDPRIRHLVPVTGRYYIAVESARVGVLIADQYYAIDFFAHDVVSELRIEAESGDGLVDPKILVVEQRPNENVILDEVGTFCCPRAPPGLLASYARLLHPGSYFVLVFESSGLTGPYRLRAQEVPVVPPVARRRP